MRRERRTVDLSEYKRRRAAAEAEITSRVYVKDCGLPITTRYLVRWHLGTYSSA